MSDHRQGPKPRGGEASFAELLAASEASPQLVTIGDRVDATVVSIGKEYVFLDLGTRADGLLPVAEVTVDGKVTLEKGQRLTVLAMAIRDGAVMCALRVGAGAAFEQQGDKEATLETLREARETGMPVEGVVKESNKGGFSVHVMGLRAFCPVSQIQRGFCETPEEHVGHTYAFAVVELDAAGRNVVVSRRRLLELEAEERSAAVMETLEVGAVLEGEVSSLKSYGAFVDIGGVEGLLHVSEISHERVADPGDILTVGQRLQVVVQEIDRERKRISLSLKALADDPWDRAASRFAEGQLVSGRVVRLAPFGAFVALEPGVEGLLHISEMSRDRRISTPREVVREGDEVKVRVQAVEPERRRISLSMIENEDDQGAAEAIETMDRLRAAEPRGGKGLGTFGDLLAKSLKK